MGSPRATNLPELAVLHRFASEDVMALIERRDRSGMLHPSRYWARGESIRSDPPDMLSWG
jgi:hypothetical protein